MTDPSTLVDPRGPSCNLESRPTYTAVNDAGTVQFHETLPTLQQMASYTVAVESWRRFVGTENPARATYYNPEYVFYFLDEKDDVKVADQLHQLQMPRSIRQRLVENCLGRVRNEMNEWARHYVQNVFVRKRFQLDGAIKVTDLVFCHWLPDGRIDYRKSATNMLSNPRMTTADRFEIACRYCFEDELRKLRVDSMGEDFAKNVSFDKNPLMCYWLCCLNDETDKLPVKNGECVESFLITAPSVDTWSAVEYFWNRLSFNEQLSKVQELLSRKPQFQKRMFSVMNEVQKRHALSTMPIEIVKNFWKQESCEKFAFLSWIRFVNTISFGQFTDLMENLLIVSLPDQEERIRYLVKMWDCSPTNFKTAALPVMSKKVISLHTQACWTRWDDETSLPTNLDFLLAFLSSASVEFRKKVLFDHADKFVFRANCDTIDELVKLCLTCADDVDEFRQFLSESPKIRSACYDMLVGSFEDRQLLASFLSNYFPDATVKAEFVNGLVLSQPWSEDCMENWTDAIRLVKVNMIDIAPETAKILKKRIIRSFARTRVQFEWTLHYVGQFVDEIVTILDAHELRDHKDTALETFRTKYDWFKFREQDIRGFLRWCLDEDEEEIARFKRSIEMDEIFEYCWKTWKRAGFFRKDLGPGEVRKEFVHLDRVLGWYFETSAEAKTYKLKKVYEVFRNDELEVDEIFANNVLPWFFDDDRAEMMKFKQCFGDHVVAQLIKVPDEGLELE